MAVYFDAVIDERMDPMFDGSVEEMLEWLRKHPEARDMDVCIGKTMQIITVKQYTKLHAK